MMKGRIRSIQRKRIVDDHFTGHVDGKHTRGTNVVPDRRLYRNGFRSDKAKYHQSTDNTPVLLMVALAPLAGCATTCRLVRFK